MTYIKYLLLITLTILLQLSLIEQFINSQFFINLPLLVIIYYNWLSPTNKTFLFTIAMGWGQSYFDALPFSMTIVQFFIIAFVIQRLSLTSLTNKTLGSLLIAGVVGTLLYTALLLLFSLGQYGITTEFVREYILSYSALLINIVIASLLLVLFKLTVFRNEISKT